MTEEVTLLEQATELEALLPRILRRLFTLQADHPVAEMPITQLRVCSILQTGARSMSALSEEMGISVSATTQIADRMERAGLVERMAGVEDRRQKWLQLTTLGAEMMRSRREMRLKRASEALEKLPEGMREEILVHLRTLLEASAATAPAIPPEDLVCSRQET